MREIRGSAKNLRALLGGTKYAIDFYQREYRWAAKQVRELIEDLSGKFLESYEPGHMRSSVEGYGHYFLGSIIVSDRDGKKFIIDGQQRLTSLTLILIHVQHLLDDAEQRGQLAELIFSQRYGRRSFNLDVEERTACMEALYTGEPFDDEDQPESVRNMLARYRNIESVFPEDLAGDALPYFADWLIENVHLVEITAYSDEDAYTIFETMNDRGLSLTPTDMLKGYLLANIADPDERTHANTVWRKRIEALQALGKDEDADGVKSWLRSQHAQTIRERKRGASPRDFDLIGTEFHRWVRDHQADLGLATSNDFAQFIESDLVFYTRWYERLRQAADELTAPLECVYYNAQNNFTLQFPVLLAPLSPGDSEELALTKIQIVSTYLDILIARRIWNGKAISYSNMQYAMFLVLKGVRGRSPKELVVLLSRRLLDESELSFVDNPDFYLTGTNRPKIHWLLARMTDFIEVQSGGASRYAEYFRGGRKKFEVEHIWANKPERHTEEFQHENDFRSYRNRVGGLLLLPKSFNASYRDAPYETKVEHYYGQNVLAKSLHPRAYEHNPGFLRFAEESELEFRAHEEFQKADLDARQALYVALAEAVWHPGRLLSFVQPTES